MKVLKRNKSLLITIITFSILYFAEMVFVLIYIKRKIKTQTINRNEDFRIQLRRID
jgi:cytochrome bd-type quinol oxidase subunit 1